MTPEEHDAYAEAIAELEPPFVELLATSDSAFKMNGRDYHLCAGDTFRITWEGVLA